MRRALLLLAIGTVVLAGCQDESKLPGRPIPTPGPQVVVRELRTISGTETVERGERIAFAVIGTGAGTHFDGTTFLNSPAFEELRVVAVLSSSLLQAQGTIAAGAGAGNKDLSVVTGNELAIAPWAFAVAQTERVKLGVPPVESGEQTLDPGGDVDLYDFAPENGQARDAVIRVFGSGTLRPEIAVYRGDGRSVADAGKSCAVVRVNSKAPVIVKVTDPARSGGAYVLRIDYGRPEDCLLAMPDDLIP